MEAELSNGLRRIHIYIEALNGIVRGRQRILGIAYPWAMASVSGLVAKLTALEVPIKAPGTRVQRSGL